MSDLAGEVVVTENAIFFSNTDDNNYLYKMNHDGTGLEKINNDVPYKMQDSDNFLYYFTKQEEDNKYDIVRINQDGADKTILRSGVICPNWPILSVSGSISYYLDYIGFINSRNRINSRKKRNT